jgi:hypothetical protein
MKWGVVNLVKLLRYGAKIVRKKRYSRLRSRNGSRVSDTGESSFQFLTTSVDDWDGLCASRVGMESEH